MKTTICCSTCGGKRKTDTWVLLFSFFALLVCKWKTKGKQQRHWTYCFFFFFGGMTKSSRFFLLKILWTFTGNSYWPHECNVMSLINFTVYLLPVQFMWTRAMMSQQQQQSCAKTPNVCMCRFRFRHKNNPAVNQSQTVSSDFRLSVKSIQVVGWLMHRLLWAVTPVKQLNM